MEDGARRLMERLAPVTVITGHYGVGKTNLALNMALDAAAFGYAVALVDIDVVNPYFRATEYRPLLEEHGVQLIAPVFAEAGTSLDVPSLTGAIVPAIQQAYREAANPKGLHVIIDAGGDDVGATALGRFATALHGGHHEVWYVVNAHRNLTETADEAYGILRSIEARSRLEVTQIVSNTHLRHETDAATIAAGIPLAQSVAKRAGVPLLLVASKEGLPLSDQAMLEESAGDGIIYPVRMIVTLPWE